MRSIAVLPVLGLLLIPLQANAACSFLPPVGGGDPIVKKKVERPKGLIGKAIGRTNWNTDFEVNQPYRSFKLFFTADSSDPSSYPVQAFLKFSDGSNKFWGHGTLASSETNACRFGTQIPTQVLLERFEEGPPLTPLTPNPSGY